MNIALLGCGVVGGGVLEIADKRADMSVKYVLVRRDKPELGEKAVKDINIILNDKEVDTVVEVMGGLSPAFEYVAAAMKAGKNVVTANKHLVAHYYKELVSLAAECGVAFRCTPAVGGGIPWLVNLERVKRLDSVQSFCGIMNGTTNFILDAMHTDGSDFPRFSPRRRSSAMPRQTPPRISTDWISSARPSSRQTFHSTHASRKRTFPCSASAAFYPATLPRPRADRASAKCSPSAKRAHRAP